MNLSPWAIPLLSVVGLAIWVVVLLQAKPILAAGTPAPSDFDIVMLSTVVIVSGSLTFSSLRYAGAIDVPAAQFATSIARIALLVGGFAAFVIVRRAQGSAAEEAGG